jgi:hypothetical protein
MLAGVKFNIIIIVFIIGIIFLKNYAINSRQIFSKNKQNKTGKLGIM